MSGKCGSRLGRHFTGPQWGGGLRMYLNVSQINSYAKVVSTYLQSGLWFIVGLLGMGMNPFFKKWNTKWADSLGLLICEQVCLCVFLFLLKFLLCVLMINAIKLLEMLNCQFSFERKQSHAFNEGLEIACGSFFSPELLGISKILSIKSCKWMLTLQS